MEPYAHLKTAQELREEGNREFKGGYYDAAAAKYRAALRKDNNWALLHCNLALCFAKQEKWEECVQAPTAASRTAWRCDAATARAGAPAPEPGLPRVAAPAAEADLDHARADLERALETGPANEVLRRELAGLLNGKPSRPSRTVPRARAAAHSIEQRGASTSSETGRRRARRTTRRARRRLMPAARVQQRLAGPAARRRSVERASPSSLQMHAPRPRRTHHRRSNNPPSKTHANAKLCIDGAPRGARGLRRPPPPGN